MEIRVEAPVGQVIGYVRQQSVVELLSLSLSLSQHTAVYSVLHVFLYSDGQISRTVQCFQQQLL